MPWNDLRDLFEVDDGSLPEIRIRYVDRRATALGYDILQKRATGVVSPIPNFWSKVTEEEIPIAAVPNAAALVVSGEAEPFHVVLGGIDMNGTTIPDLGVFVFSDQIVLEYRMGPHWSHREVSALFELLTNLVTLDTQASISLKDRALDEVKDGFRKAWRHWCTDR